MSIADDGPNEPPKEPPKDALSHRILTSDPETPGCFSAPLFLILGGSVALYSGAPLWAIALIGGASAVGGYLVTTGSWWGFQRLYTSVYKSLPGRINRDVKRLSVWAQQHDCLIQVRDDSAGFIQLQVLPHKRLSLPPGNIKARLAEKKRLELLGWSIYLDVEPWPTGYGLRVRFQVTEAWRKLLLPCMADTKHSLRDWLSCLPFGDEEERLIRPFVWRLLEDRGDHEPMLTDEEALLYVHGRELYEWGFDKAYWTHNETTLKICKEVSLEALEEELLYYKTQALRLQQTLAKSQLPLLTQVTQELVALSWPARLPYLRPHKPELRAGLEQERRTAILHFWELLLREHSDYEETREAFLQLLGSASASLVVPLVDRLSGAESVALIVSWVEAFLRGAWRDVLATQPRRILGRERGYRRFVEPYGGYDMAGEPDVLTMDFGVCFGVLEAAWALEPFLGLCCSLGEPVVEKPQEESEGASGELVVNVGEENLTQQLREEALTQWCLKAGEARLVPQLLAWLQHESPRFRCLVLDVIGALALTGEGLEEAVLAQVAPRERAVPRREQLVRVAAIEALGAMGTGRATVALGRGMEIWDPNTQQSAIDAADEALERIYKGKRSEQNATPILQGALSSPEDADAEGQLSFSGEGGTDAEGRLSLPLATSVSPNKTAKEGSD